MERKEAGHRGSELNFFVFSYFSRIGKESIDSFYMQDKLTKQTVMELTLSEQLRERQEMEKKLQKLAKTMDYLERAKREEAAPLVEAAYQQRLVEEKALHELEQQVFLRFC